MRNLFLFKLNDDSDNDCCVYVDTTSINLCGACFCGCIDKPSYSDVRTVLSESDYNFLMGNLHSNKEVLQGIFEKLKSDKAQKFFDKIQEEEKEWLMDEYNFSENDIDDIWNEYGEDYRDRAIVSYVYDDSDALGYEEAFSLGYMDNNDTIAQRYFDYKRFGEDLVNEDEYYMELSDERVVCLAY